MIQIEKDKHIKCVFKNGTVVEGVVRDWTKENAVLLSIHDGSQIVIMHPEKDIQFIKILSDQAKEQAAVSSAEPETNVEAIKENIREKVREIQAEAMKDDSGPNDLNSKSVEELRKMVIEQDRQIVANKIKQHFSTGQASNKYTSQLGIFQRK